MSKLRSKTFSGKHKETVNLWFSFKGINIFFAPPAKAEKVA